MTLKQFISVVPKLMRYNMKVIFAGKFIWFILIALGIYGAVMTFTAWQGGEINEGTLYTTLLLPALLLVFYPSVFGIQNDEDNRILEIIFGVPNYRYKVWGVRLLMIYLIVFVILIGFAYIGRYMLYPIEPLSMSVQLMFPVLFFGNLAFMLSTIVRSGNGTAVVVIILGFFLLLFSESLGTSFWNIYINPFNMPSGMHEFIWENTLLKNRIMLIVAAVVWVMLGSLNLQKREKFV